MGNPKRAEYIPSFFDNAQEVSKHREFWTYTGKYKGIKVVATSTGIGGHQHRLPFTSFPSPFYAPLEYPAVASFEVAQALVEASKNWAIKLLESGHSFT